jgi:EAL domain-containing protein (putative c-di-GMP-specific phosphodiesterase class I)
VSAEWLEEPEFVRTTLAALRAAAVDPRSVVLEITESSLLRDLAERGHRLEELRRWGIRIAIDDFGTGYSSLSYLRELPIDIVKLDKEFVSDVDASTESRLIVQAILDLAKALRLEVIAEGVERESQFSTLVQLGCNAFQGYLLGRPASLEEAKAMAMRQWPADPFASDYDWTTAEPSPIENIVHADFRRLTG